MAEQIIINGIDKEAKYQELVPQLTGLVMGEDDVIANMANISAGLAMVFDWLWIGFYLVKDSVLVLGPFQGPIACTRIAYNKGVCGKAWSSKQVQIVPNVDLFTGHIACSSLAKSEIVLPLINSAGEVWAVLDIDSAELNTFDEIDAKYLRQVTELLIKRD